MATAILRSHDILRDRYGPNPNPRITGGSRCRRRKRDAGRRSNSSSTSPTPATSKGLVMGQVKILKREEEFQPRLFFSGAGDDGVNGGGDGGGDDGGGESSVLGLCSTNPLGPDPEVVQKQIRVPDLYAGTNLLVSSPPPSDLPFPSALVRARAMETDLRKMLKI